MHDFDTDDTASVARSDDTGRSELDGMAYDTPRSSVSGGGPYRRPDQEPDLLMFDDMQARNNEAASRHPGSSQDMLIPINSSILDTPPQNESLLLSGKYAYSFTNLNFLNHRIVLFYFWILLVL